MGTSAIVQEDTVCRPCVIDLCHVKPLLDNWEPFQSLNIPGVSNCVHVDTGGYGIVWNDELDLSANELWNNGVPVKH